MCIGYVFGDFSCYVVGWLIYGIFECYNWDKFEVFGYYLLGVSDEIIEIIKNGCDEFRYLN